MTDRGRVEASGHHNVYVVRLNKKVLEKRRFREANPEYCEEKPCVYVGLTGLDPHTRFKNHKKGNKSSRYVKEYGQHLMRKQYEKYNPMPYDEAVKMEKKLASKLRRKGWAVWQH